MNSINSLELINAALSVREKQLSLTASNLANKDTPNFKAKGLDFKTEMSNIINGTSFSLNKTSPRHLDGVNIVSNSINYQNNGAERADGNTVNSDVEKAKFADYQVQYQAALELSSKKTTSIIKALESK